MIVTGLSLLTGAKADPRLVRVGAGRALVEGRWQLDAATAAAVAVLGGEVDADGVLTSRQLSASRSRMTIGGAQVPAGIGQDLVGEWVTVHGQSEQLRLGTPERQREVLDRYAGPELDGLLTDYRERFEQRRRLMTELAELTDQAQARLRELDLLRFGLDEIARVEPQPGEDVTLAAEAKLLQSIDDVRLAVHTGLMALAGDEDSYGEVPDALGLVGAARKALVTAVAADDSLTGLASELDDAAAALADVASGLAGYLAGLDADPVRLEWIAGRQADLQALTRKYGATIDEVLAYAAESAARVTTLDSADARIEELQVQLAALDADLGVLATRLTDLRTAAAERLEAAVRGELAALAMPKARLRFEVAPLTEPGPHGADQISLLFSANPGSAPGPLAKVASGGELSRVRLALEVVLAETTPGQTFVFDEVDAGVGGAVALEIGRRLARLARHSQVIVVTHLAQVAAFADKHFQVTKADDGQVTTSGVRQVAADDRLAVLARMMGGLDSSESALAHATELLEQASSRASR
ncbi:MAG: DNA repair protein RecN, partial [Propionicimonas sp.]|nr:DNA repair protein RecN [Propionicimonas sp.]